MRLRRKSSDQLNDDALARRLHAELNEAGAAQDAALKKIKEEQAKRPQSEEPFGLPIPESASSARAIGQPSPRFPVGDLEPQPVHVQGPTHRGEPHPDADSIKEQPLLGPTSSEPPSDDDRVWQEHRQKLIKEGKILTEHDLNQVVAYMDDQPREGVFTKPSHQYVYNGPMGKRVVIGQRPRRRRRRSFRSLQSSLHREAMRGMTEYRGPPKLGRFRDDLVSD
jgi:hypothetical protein